MIFVRVDTRTTLMRQVENSIAEAQRSMTQAIDADDAFWVAHYRTMIRQRKELLRELKAKQA